MTAVRLSEEFGFELVLHHCTEGYPRRRGTGQAQDVVSVTLVDSPGGKPEVLGLLEENAAIMSKAGSRSPSTPTTSSPSHASSSAPAPSPCAAACRRDLALKGLTLHAPRCCTWKTAAARWKRARTPTSSSCRARRFSVYTQVLKPSSRATRSSTAPSTRTGPYQSGGFALANQKRLPSSILLLSRKRLLALRRFRRMHPNSTARRSASRCTPAASTRRKGTITDGVILVEDGKVTHVGPRNGFQLPADTPVLTAAVVTPGLIDTQTVGRRVGMLNMQKADQDQDENSDPNQADCRVLDSFNPGEPLLEFVPRARRDGGPRHAGPHQRDRGADGHLPHLRHHGRER